MLAILDEDIEKVKGEMKEASKKVTRRIKYHAYGTDSLEALQRKKMLYQVSRTLPVRVGSIIINYKLYEAYMKKLKGFVTETKVTDEGLTLTYRKLFGDRSDGMLVLTDISEYFKDFEYIPLAGVADGETA